MLIADTAILFKASSGISKAACSPKFIHNKLLWKNSLIRGSDRLASDTTDISNGLNTEGFLVNMDNEKAFSPLDYNLIVIFGVTWGNFQLGK